MKLTFVNLYSSETVARYLLSSYILKAYLLKRFADTPDLTVTILNFRNTADAAKVCEKIKKDQPDFVGYSCYTWNVEKVFDIIKGLKDTPGMGHVLGGPEINMSRIESLKDSCSRKYFIIGPGEKILADFVSYLYKVSEQRPAEVPEGVAFWSEDKIIYKESTHQFSSLDEIPSVYLSGTLEEKFYARQQAFLETSRGCKFKCNYCMYHKNLSSVSYYSLDRVMAEIDYLILDKEIWQLRIFDSDFASDLSRAKKIIEHLIAIKPTCDVFPWIYWEFTFSGIDEEFIRLSGSLKDRERILNSSTIEPQDKPQCYSDMLEGYHIINCIGIQSFNPKALRSVNRMRVHTQEFFGFMETVNHHNVVLKIDFILGLPFETLDSYFEGLELFLPYLKDTDHVLNIHLLQILPGSKLERKCEEFHIRYALEAPNFVFATNTLPEKELRYATKLTAVLFRVVNSPLRKLIYETKRSSGKAFLEIIRDLYESISAKEEFKTSQLVQKDFVDDYYWNGDIYKEITSAYLADYFRT
ncbi:B12-binding domain-containing radical SAM protein [Fibrobacterota bacterium]